ncbi:MAG TPA: hypothetical protein VLC47_09320 [Burkholderiales bacterium]|nr:hypothetical protein [Burkholderiales bacterium]
MGRAPQALTPEALRRSAVGTRPPAGLSPPLEALWHDAKGDWATAHRVVMNAQSTAAAWVHAYLHRKEGDLDNARYWYRKAKKPEASSALEAEWNAIAEALLARR